MHELRRRRFGRRARVRARRRRRHLGARTVNGLCRTLGASRAARPKNGRGAPLQHLLHRARANLIRVALKKPREGQPLETAAACPRARVAADRDGRRAHARRRGEAVGRAGAARAAAVGQADVAARRRARGVAAARRSGEAARGLVDAYCNKLHAHALASGWPAAQSALLAPPAGAARALAGEAITLARREWILEGRHAEPCAAAALLLAARGHGLPFKEQDLAAIGMKANAKAPRTPQGGDHRRRLAGEAAAWPRVAVGQGAGEGTPPIHSGDQSRADAGVEALRDGGDSDDDGDGDGEAAPGGGTSLVPAGAVVVRRDDSLLAALGASDPAAFVASAARARRPRAEARRRTGAHRRRRRRGEHGARHQWREGGGGGGAARC